MFEISSDIPAPQCDATPYPMTGKAGRPAVYPWRDMAVGQSIFVPGKKSVGGSLAGWRAKHPEQRFSQRVEPDGVRVWRVA